VRRRNGRGVDNGHVRVVRSPQPFPTPAAPLPGGHHHAVRLGPREPELCQRNEGPSLDDVTLCTLVALRDVDEVDDRAALSEERVVEEYPAVKANIPGAASPVAYRSFASSFLGSTGRSAFAERTRDRPRNDEVDRGE